MVWVNLATTNAMKWYLRRNLSLERSSDHARVANNKPVMLFEVESEKLADF